jgi:hypothetical protein
MQRKLEETPMELDKLFFGRFEQGEIFQTVLILQWVLFAQKLLSPEELYLAVLAGSQPEELRKLDQSNLDEELIQRFITTVSRGLIEIRNKDCWSVDDHPVTVQFIHKSVSDFLLRNNTLQSLDPTLGTNITGPSHERIVECCVSYFVMQDCDISDRDSLLNDYPFSDYAFSYVLVHMEHAQKDGVNQQKNLEFLEIPINFKKLKAFDLYNLSDCGHDAGFLYFVVLNQHLHPAEVLLEGGADVNAKGGTYGNVLQAAAAKGFDQIVMLLLRNSADINAPGGEYGTALQAAAWYSHTTTVKLLLDNGANPNVQGGRFGNALQASAIDGNEQVNAAATR